jgi:alginate O-acetyltransferase complex protein AlgI
LNFNSLEFLVLFLPATLLVFYAVPRHLRLWVLVGASLVFYGVSGPEVLLAFVIAIAWGYATAFLLQRWPKALALVMAVSVPAFTLVMFKYLGFILDSVQAGPDMRAHFSFFLGILLPAGISFYTFEIVSYSIDVADGKIPPERDALRFAGFATFFPHLAAKATGLAAGEALALDRLVQVAFWSMQIYYDFWAYSVMAIGLGRLFCVELPVNFREPYLSANPREFWQRWHITLSYWLRDYVYIRMGGREAYVRNILIVFALVGLWHGAGWNFVAWGVYHGALVILYHVTRPAWDRLPHAVSVALTFTLVSFGWPLFFLSLGDYWAFLRDLATLPWGVEQFGLRHLLFLAAIGLVTFGVREKVWLDIEPPLGRLEQRRLLGSPVLAAALMFAGMLCISLSKTFIYFRF